METNDKYEEALKKARKLYPGLDATEKATFECIFGREAFVTQINTWDDLETMGNVMEMGAGIEVYGKHCYRDPISRKALAMMQIAQLIDAAYGGVCSPEEHHTKVLFGIDYDFANDRLNVRSSEYTYDLLTFHTKEQAERFLKHNEQLVRDYYMLPSKNESE